jgi:hypothetical protein
MAMKSGRLRRITVFILMIVIAYEAGALELRAIKTVTWTVVGSPSTLVGTYGWVVGASAQDNHISEMPPPNASLAIWSIPEGLPARAPTDSISAGQQPHPSANSTIDLSATRPRDLQNGLFEVTGVIDSDLKVTTGPPEDHKNQLPVAGASAQMALPSAFIQGTVLALNDQLFEVETTTEAGKISFAAQLFGDGQAQWQGPVRLTLFEAETGSTVSQDLYSYQANTNFLGTLSFGSSAGILLQAPSDGRSSVSLSGGATSTWVTTGPGFFSASLANGVFRTSGLLDSLPWVLTFDGSDVVGAMLASEFVPEQSFAYRVPSSLLTETNHYQQTLSFDLSASISESVPEPSSISLVILAILLAICARAPSSERCLRFELVRLGKLSPCKHFRLRFSSPIKCSGMVVPQL